MHRTSAGPFPGHTDVALGLNRLRAGRGNCKPHKNQHSKHTQTQSFHPHHTSSLISPMIAVEHRPGTSLNGAVSDLLAWPAGAESSSRKSVPGRSSPRAFQSESGPVYHCPSSRTPRPAWRPRRR